MYSHILIVLSSPLSHSLLDTLTFTYTIELDNSTFKMKSSILLLSLLSCFLESTSAQAPPPITTGTCYTLKGFFPVKTVNTKNIAATSTVKLVETITYTPTVSIKPPPSTVTTTVTQPSTFTNLQITDTYTATSYTGKILTITSTVGTNTQIDTVSTTLTTTVAVTELPTPDAFKPVQSTLPGGKKRDLAPISRIKRTVSPLERRTFSICAALPKKGTQAFAGFTAGFPFLYPMSVTCYNVVTVYTVRYVTQTAQIPATVTLAPGVVTNAVTVYNTITTTVPNASFTTTVYLSSDGTTTTFYTASTTTTTTVTATETRALATAYAACRADNIAGGVGNDGIWEVYTNATPAAVPYTNAATATDCCTACFVNPDCASYVYQAAAPAGQQCRVVLLASGTCKVPGSYSLGVNVGGGYKPGEGYTVGNGYCGAVTGVNNA